MKTINKIELKLEKFEKCYLILDYDCPLGQLYDYAYALKHFIGQRIQEEEEKEKPEDEQKAV